MAWNKLMINPDVISKHFTQVDNVGGNGMLETSLVPDVIFMKYRAENTDCYVIFDKANFNEVASKMWARMGNYVGRHEGKIIIYFHQVMVANLALGEIVHHLGHRFDNRTHKLRGVIPSQHDRHRAYDSDLHITIDNIMRINMLIG